MKVAKIFTILVLLAFFMPLYGYAQKKQINQARDILKEGKEPHKAEELMRGLLNDSIHRSNLRIWTILANAMMMQYEQANEKLYLKQELDTVAFFHMTQRMFLDMQKLDSLDARPGKKGHVAPKYRERHASYLNAIRPNLNVGGAFFMRKYDYRQAANFFECYIDGARQPLFSSFDYLHTDAQLPVAAYWVMSCAYHLNDADLILKHQTLAQRDSLHLENVLRYLSEAYNMKGDTAQYVATLHRGFKHFPKKAYFFPRLVDYYEQTHQFDSAMWVVEHALQADSASMLARYAKCTLLLNMGRYGDCINIGKQLIAENDSLSDVYYVVGLAYFNQAIHKEKQLMMGHTKRSVRNNEKRQIANLYAQSLPYLQHYKTQMPEAIDKWGDPLYTIYFNLNMGKEFDEIDKLRNEHRKRP